MPWAKPSLYASSRPSLRPLGQRGLHGERVVGTRAIDGFLDDAILILQQFALGALDGIVDEDGDLVLREPTRNWLDFLIFERHQLGHFHDLGEFRQIVDHLGEHRQLFRLGANAVRPVALDQRIGLAQQFVGKVCLVHRGRRGHFGCARGFAKS